MTAAVSLIGGITKFDLYHIISVIYIDWLLVSQHILDFDVVWCQPTCVSFVASFQIWLSSEVFTPSLR